MARQQQEQGKQRAQEHGNHRSGPVPTIARTSAMRPAACAIPCNGADFIPNNGRSQPTRQITNSVSTTQPSAVAASTNTGSSHGPSGSDASHAPATTVTVWCSTYQGKI